jgi:hypothetical protein
MKTYFDSYYLAKQQRDLRFDFIRGLAMTLSSSITCLFHRTCTPFP